MSRPHIIGVRETHNGSVADGMEEKLGKEKMRQKMYCQAELNRRILCIKRSLEEVYAILNTGYCHKK